MPGGLELRSQTGGPWARHSPEDVPTGQHFCTATFSWAESQRPRPAGHALLVLSTWRISPGSLIDFQTGPLRMDACEPWGRGPGHTHPSPSLGSPCGPTWGRTMWYLPMGSGETTWHELPCPERDAGRAPIWLETTVIAHSSKPSSCCHRAGACHGLWGGTTQYSTGLHLALLPCSRASLPGC